MADEELAMLRAAALETMKKGKSENAGGRDDRTHASSSSSSTKAVSSNGQHGAFYGWLNQPTPAAMVYQGYTQPSMISGNPAYGQHEMPLGGGGYVPAPFTSYNTGPPPRRYHHSAVHEQQQHGNGGHYTSHHHHHHHRGHQHFGGARHYAPNQSRNSNLVVLHTDEKTKNQQERMAIAKSQSQGPPSATTPAAGPATATTAAQARAKSQSPDRRVLPGRFARLNDDSSESEDDDLDYYKKD